jgi:hypothetical protein
LPKGRKAEGEGAMGKLSSTVIIKIGVVTGDIFDTVERYKRLFALKTEPIIHVPDPANPKPAAAGAYKHYKGKAYNILLKSAHIELDPIYLEILEPFDDTPSPWLDHLKKYGPGVCFISFYVEGFRHEIDLMEGEGYRQIFEEEKGYERYAYFDTLEKLGLTIELKERGEK